MHLKGFSFVCLILCRRSSVALVPLYSHSYLCVYAIYGCRMNQHGLNDFAQTAQVKSILPGKKLWVVRLDLRPNLFSQIVHLCWFSLV